MTIILSMEGAAESLVGLSFFDIGEATEGQTFRRVTLIEADGRRSVQIGGLPVYVYEADDKGAEAVCILTSLQPGHGSALGRSLAGAR
jgi:hypothetical protein